MDVYYVLLFVIWLPGLKTGCCYALGFFVSTDIVFLGGHRNQVMERKMTDSIQTTAELTEDGKHNLINGGKISLLMSIAKPSF